MGSKKNPYYFPDPLLRNGVDPHVGSFDYFIEEGISAAIADLDPLRISLPDGKCLNSMIFIHYSIPIILNILSFFLM